MFVTMVSLFLLLCFTLRVDSRQHRRACQAEKGEILGARACLFFNFFLRRDIFTVWSGWWCFCWLNWTENSFRCFYVSSWRSKSVLKKSASVLANDSALCVPILCETCLSAFTLHVPFSRPVFAFRNLRDACVDHCPTPRRTGLKRLKRHSTGGKKRDRARTRVSLTSKYKTGIPLDDSTKHDRNNL